MIETNIKICDVCRDRKAKYKCYVCKKDVCNADIRKFRYDSLHMFFRYELKAIMSTEEGDIFICSNCSHNLTKEPFHPDEGFNRKIMDLIIKYKLIKEL